MYVTLLESFYKGIERDRIKFSVPYPPVKIVRAKSSPKHISKFLELVNYEKSNKKSNS
jgi:hypothetical protein